MNKRLFLIFHGRFPSEKAASLFAAKSAEIFGKKGIPTTLLVPERRGALQKDPFEYYGIDHSFDLVFLKTPSLFGIQSIDRVAFVVSYFFFSMSALSYIKRNSRQEDIIFSNELFPLALISYIRRNCFYEMHDFPESKLGLFGWLLGKMKWILIHNKWKMNEAQKIFSTIPAHRFLYEPNAVDIKAFDISCSREEAREKLKLPLKMSIVVYTGHLYGWKGVDTLALAARTLPDTFLVVFVGGTTEDVKRFKEKYAMIPQIMIVGHVPHSEIPLWQKAADVLVLPNTAKEKISAFYTSPMKLFEYMASSRPIVATDIPSLREIISEASAKIVPADEPGALAEGILSVLQDPTGSQAIVEQAFKDVAGHTWEKRAERIIAFMSV